MITLRNKLSPAMLQVAAKSKVEKSFKSLKDWQTAAKKFKYALEQRENARLGVFYVAMNGADVAGSFCAKYPKDSYMLPPDDPKFQSAVVASVEFNEKEQKWYGASHRGSCGFGIGDMLFEEDCIQDDNTPFVDAGRVKITTLDQAKTAAENFMEYVS